MFDFPSSPAIGTVSNGYTFNGVGWAGGPGVSGPVTEQFFDLSGLATKDIAVPTWAKGGEFTYSYYPPSGGPVLQMRASADGTTFLSGATDYSQGGPFHYLVPSGTYGSAAAATMAQWVITALGGTTISVPHQGEFTVTVARGLTGDGFAFRAHSRTLDAASGITAGWYGGWINGSAPGSALRIMALRFFLSAAGVMGPASWLKVRWIGDSAAIPQSNAIADAPSDGGEYTRVNGAWRLKSQFYDVSGLTQKDVTVPSWAKGVELSICIFPPAVSQNFIARISGDGTTFPAGASDYAFAQAWHITPVTPAYGSGTPTSTAYLLLGSSGDNVSLPHLVDAFINVARANTSQYFTARSYAKVYGAPNNSSTIWNHAWANAGTIAQLQLAALRFSFASGGVMGNGSFIIVKWVG